MWLEFCGLGVFSPLFFPFPPPFVFSFPLFCVWAPTYLSPFFGGSEIKVVDGDDTNPHVDECDMSTCAGVGVDPRMRPANGAVATDAPPDSEG